MCAGEVGCALYTQAGNNFPVVCYLYRVRCLMVLSAQVLAVGSGAEEASHP